LGPGQRSILRQVRQVALDLGHARPGDAARLLLQLLAERGASHAAYDLAEPFLAEADKIGVEDDHPGHDQRRDGLGRIDEAAPQPQAERSAVAVPIAAGAATPLARLLGRAPAVLVVDLRSRAIPA